MKMKIVMIICFLGVLSLSGCSTLTHSNTNSTNSAVSTDDSVSPSDHHSQSLGTENLSKLATINAQLAIKYISDGRLDIAKHKLNKAEKQDVRLPIVHYAYGFYYEKLKDSKQAGRQYAQALQLGPNNHEALEYYALFLCRGGNLDKAEPFFKQALDLKENDEVAQTYTRYAECLMMQKAPVMYSQIQDLLEKSLKQDAKFSLSYYYLAKLAYDQKDYKKADQYMKSYVNFMGNSKLGLPLEIKIAKQLGRKDEAASLQLKLNSEYPNTQ